MKIFSGLLTGLLGLAVLLTGCGDGDSDFSLSSSEPLVSVAKKDANLYIDILGNDLQIQNIEANRGNCLALLRDEGIAYTMKYRDENFKFALNTMYLNKNIDDETVKQYVYNAVFSNLIASFNSPLPTPIWQKYRLSMLTIKEQIEQGKSFSEILAEDEKIERDLIKSIQEAEVFFVDAIKEYKHTKKYQFGDQVSVGVMKNGNGDACNLREVAIKTNKGTWGFNWQQ